jgi:hypothetical protein
VASGVGERFPELLHHPLGGRMSGEVEVQDAPSPMIEAWARCASRKQNWLAISTPSDDTVTVEELFGPSPNSRCR